MRGSARRAARPLPRLRRLVLSRNELRRPSDRIEATVIMSLVAIFLAIVVAAACFAGHLRQSRHELAARSRQIVAVPSGPGPRASRTTVLGSRWRRADGTRRSGAQTAAPDPVIYHGAAGTAVREWPGHPGEPRPLRSSRGDRIADALLAGMCITVGAAVVLILCYRLCRAALDRHRLARWEAAWAVVGPKWTSRR
jgi:hypothetical protein